MGKIKHVLGGKKTSAVLLLGDLAVMIWTVYELLFARTHSVFLWIFGEPFFWTTLFLEILLIVEGYIFLLLVSSVYFKQQSEASENR